MVIKISDKKNEVIDNPQKVFNILKSVLDLEDEIDQDKEHFWVLHLDSRNVLRVLELVSLGTLNASLVHPREVFVRAIANRSAQIIVAHNHPSNTLEPSEDDIKITKRLYEAGKIIGIEVIDHIIITKNGFVSFKKEGIL